MLYLTDAVASYCAGVESYLYLMEVCDRLPSDKCLPSPLELGELVIAAGATVNLPTYFIALITTLALYFILSL